MAPFLSLNINIPKLKFVLTILKYMSKQENSETASVHRPSPLLVPVPVDDDFTAGSINGHDLPTVECSRIMKKLGSKDNLCFCAVCLTLINGFDEVRELGNCFHLFHRECIDAWIHKGKETCPKAVRFYSSIFQDLISEGFLGPSSKVLCIETQIGVDVFALKEIGVEDSIGIFKKAFKPLVISGQGFKQPFKNSTFDFVFSCGGMIEKSAKLADFAMEISRTLKPEGLLVVHMGTGDNYRLNSFLDLFHFCKLLKTRDIDGIDSKMPFIREIVMKKVSGL
ncbi:Methyltransferase domain-containing protein [Forsythia ovata]|uniref:Methyltransferase domain-containing protein n=1 Tax=Forsythia ovata TaxID=205694 RepID=A0ABD1X2V6_9LAMI